MLLIFSRFRADELQELFNKFGDVKDVYMPKDYHTKYDTLLVLELVVV